MQAQRIAIIVLAPFRYNSSGDQLRSDRTPLLPSAALERGEDQAARITIIASLAVPLQFRRADQLPFEHLRISVRPLGRVERGVVALLPDVPDEGLVAVHVALVVEADRAEDGVEFVRAQRRDDRLGFDRAGLLDRLRPDLDPGIGIQRQTFRFIAIRAEFLDYCRCFLVGARIGVRDKPHAHRRRPGDLLEILAEPAHHFRSSADRSRGCAPAG